MTSLPEIKPSPGQELLFPIAPVVPRTREQSLAHTSSFLAAENLANVQSRKAWRLGDHAEQKLTKRDAYDR